MKFVMVGGAVHANTTSDYKKNRKNFRFLSGGRNGLSALNWTKKCECRLKI